MVHARENLLALRIHGQLLDAAVWDYAPDVAVFGSGLEAAQHGLSGIENLSPAAERKIAGLLKRRGVN